MTTTLYYREGSSDKVYQASIVPDPTASEQGFGKLSEKLVTTLNPKLYLVTFAFGRRGGTLNTGQKTPQPISLAEAQKIHAKLIKDKKAKGYTEDTSGTPAPVMMKQPSATSDTTLALEVPMLLNSITEDELEKLLNDDRWCVQEKHDGKRMTLHSDGFTVTARNKRGLPCGVPQTVIAAMLGLTDSCVIDGECVGEILYAFDLLELGGMDMRKRSYSARYSALYELLVDDGDYHPLHLQPVETEDGMTGDKAEFYNALRERNAEGIVFKDLHAAWRSDRPNSGGPALKFKFVETASCIVAKQNAKNSVGLVLLDQNGRHVPVGNVTIPPNHMLPPPFAVCEVRYLYAYPGGSLFQPVYLGPRDDVATEECLLSQLKLKAA